MLPIDEIDLQALARTLRARVGATLLENYLDGRTLFRDAVVEILDCSLCEAEELVDTLEAREYLYFPKLRDETHSIELSQWEIRG